MNKFAEWIEQNDRKQRGIAQKIGISTSTLHEILRMGKIPSLKVAYAIEKYTQGEITVYDWIDQSDLDIKNINTKKRALKNSTTK